MSTSTASKYANLPDIDREQPDVYETPDVPQDEMNLDEPEVPVSEDISTSAVSSSGDVDSATALKKYQSSLLRTLQLESLSGDLEVSSQSALSETPEQRLRRLVFETQELRAQLEQDGNGKQEKKAVALMQLASGLQEELGQLSESAPEAPAKRPVRAVGGQDVAVMEKRIAALEKTLGAKDSATGPALVDAVARLRQQLDVIADPQRIEGIQRRVKQALIDFDRLDHAQTQAIKAAEGERSAGLDANAVKRIDELYEKFSNIDSLSLATLHVEASEAVARIGKIEKEQGSMTEELSTVKEIASSLRDSISENTSTLKENVKYLDDRIAKLNERISAL
ncbi:hypothetical protein DL89DRAFT_323217 [Linderina pennispora]|uniref:Uncharacterized protein n=1 Tax=Linderina pennispora TaxID=61395 RepID=A0A1Y1W682_9FUNG|nr:uncharacterized protein DL89DRAFT_323217 [Linderina pennispora]ORX69057.1 hypothetical protein DL89DRAFT_323217 [Linderina pennispora]